MRRLRACAALLMACACAPGLYGSAAAVAQRSREERSSSTSTTASTAGNELLCTYTLRTPHVAAGGKSARFVAARVVAAGCGPAVGAHTVRDRDAALYGADMDAFLARLAAPAWRRTAVALHGCPAPNATAIAAQ